MEMRPGDWWRGYDIERPPKNRVPRTWLPPPTIPTIATSAHPRFIRIEVLLIPLVSSRDGCQLLLTYCKGSKNAENHFLIFVLAQQLLFYQFWVRVLYMCSFLRHILKSCKYFKESKTETKREHQASLKRSRESVVLLSGMNSLVGSSWKCSCGEFFF